MKSSSYREVRDDYFSINTTYLCQNSRLKTMQEELNEQKQIVERLEKERAEKYNEYLRMQGKINMGKLRNALVGYVENNDDLFIFADIIVKGIGQMSDDQAISLANAIDSISFDQLMG